MPHFRVDLSCVANAGCESSIKIDAKDQQDAKNKAMEMHASKLILWELSWLDFDDVEVTLSTQEIESLPSNL